MASYKTQSLLIDAKKEKTQRERVFESIPKLNRYEFESCGTLNNGRRICYCSKQGKCLCGYEETQKRQANFCGSHLNYNFEIEHEDEDDESKDNSRRSSNINHKLSIIPKKLEFPKPRLQQYDSPKISTVNMMTGRTYLKHFEISIKRKINASHIKTKEEILHELLSRFNNKKIFHRDIICTPGGIPMPVHPKGSLPIVPRGSVQVTPNRTQTRERQINMESEGSISEYAENFEVEKHMYKSDQFGQGFQPNQFIDPSTVLHSSHFESFGSEISSSSNLNQQAMFGSALENDKFSELSDNQTILSTSTFSSSFQPEKEIFEPLDDLSSTNSNSYLKIETGNNQIKIDQTTRAISSRPSSTQHTPTSPGKSRPNSSLPSTNGQYSSLSSPKKLNQKFQFDQDEGFEFPASSPPLSYPPPPIYSASSNSSVPHALNFPHENMRTPIIEPHDLKPLSHHPHPQNLFPSPTKSHAESGLQHHEKKKLNSHPDNKLEADVMPFFPRQSQDSQRPSLTSSSSLPSTSVTTTLTSPTPPQSFALSIAPSKNRRLSSLLMPNILQNQSQSTHIPSKANSSTKSTISDVSQVVESISESDNNNEDITPPPYNSFEPIWNEIENDDFIYEDTADGTTDPRFSLDHIENDDNDSTRENDIERYVNEGRIRVSASQHRDSEPNFNVNPLQLPPIDPDESILGGKKTTQSLSSTLPSMSSFNSLSTSSFTPSSSFRTRPSLLAISKGPLSGDAKAILNMQEKYQAMKNTNANANRLSLNSTIGSDENFSIHEINQQQQQFTTHSLNTTLPELLEENRPSSSNSISPTKEQARSRVSPSFFDPSNPLALATALATGGHTLAGNETQQTIQTQQGPKNTEIVDLFFSRHRNGHAPMTLIDIYQTNEMNAPKTVRNSMQDQSTMRKNSRIESFIQPTTSQSRKSLATSSPSRASRTSLTSLNKLTPLKTPNNNEEKAFFPPSPLGGLIGSKIIHHPTAPTQETPLSNPGDLSFSDSTEIKEIDFNHSMFDASFKESNSQDYQMSQELMSPKFPQMTDPHFQINPTRNRIFARQGKMKPNFFKKSGLGNALQVVQGTEGESYIRSHGSNDSGLFSSPLHITHNPSIENLSVPMDESHLMMGSSTANLNARHLVAESSFNSVRVHLLRYSNPHSSQRYIPERVELPPPLPIDSLSPISSVSKFLDHQRSHSPPTTKITKR